MEHVTSTSDPERKSPPQPASDTVIVKCHLQSKEEKTNIPTTTWILLTEVGEGGQELGTAGARPERTLQGSGLLSVLARWLQASQEKGRVASGPARTLQIPHNPGFYQVSRAAAP